MRRRSDNLPDTFLALDFELAQSDPRSICAVGAVAVAGGQVVWECRALVRPLGRQVSFAHVHGLSWEDLDRQRPFNEVWLHLLPEMRLFGVWVAHNAAFERKVLRAAAQEWKLARPRVQWVCTMILAQRRLGAQYRSLPAVCTRLGIPLEHHDPLSDARAAARIVLALRRKPSPKGHAEAGA